MFSFNALYLFFHFLTLFHWLEACSFIRIKILLKCNSIQNIRHTSAGAKISLEQLVFMEPLRAANIDQFHFLLLFSEWKVNKLYTVMFSYLRKHLG